MALDRIDYRATITAPTNTYGGRSRHWREECLLRMVALLANWDNANGAREVSKGIAARAHAGYWNGTLPFGYTNPPLAQMSRHAIQQILEDHCFEMTYLPLLKFSRWVHSPDTASIK